jgi:hypothetical protein
LQICIGIRQWTDFVWLTVKYGDHFISRTGLGWAATSQCGAGKGEPFAVPVGV